MIEKPFWENTYSDFTVSTFGTASQEIIEIAKKLTKNADVLDVGCGEGRNALFLAGLGFNVDAFDISKNGIEKLQYYAKQKNITINAFVEDMGIFRFIKEYDLIITHGVLHLTEREKWKRIIEDMKLHTKRNGVNVNVVFTDSLPIPDDLKEYCLGLFHENEIREFYQDWDIEYYQSYNFHDEHPNGSKHHHAANKIVAWKRR